MVDLNGTNEPVAAAEPPSPGAVADLLGMAREAADLCRRIDPLNPRPVYVLPEAAVPQSLHDAGCWGYTRPWLDVSCRPVIERLGWWDGRGFATVISATERNAFLRVAFHEYCHFAERDPVGPWWEIDPATDPNHDFIRRLIEAPACSGPDDLTLPQNHDHGLLFTRFGCHVDFRLRMLGVNSSLVDMDVAGSRYGLSAAETYRQALGDEPQQWLDRPLWELKDHPAPDAFVSLWLDDTGGMTTGQMLDRWLAKQEQAEGLKPKNRA